MDKIIICPDSFKGSMSSTTVCSIIEKKAKYYFEEAEIVTLPIADGGEGTVDVLLTSVGGEKVYATCSGPNFETIETYYGALDNKIAVIELASCSGLTLIKGEKDPSLTTTYGVGQLILDAAKKGFKEIIVALGGSATNDGGSGAASAVGIKFLNKEGKSFIPTGKTLREVKSIDFSDKNPLLDGIKVTTMCDVANPLLGENGASKVYSPQKGATPDMVELLEEGMRSYAEVVESSLKEEFKEIKGVGAAGGMGFGMVAFFNSTLEKGIDVVLDAYDFENHLKGASFVITGEGKFDNQSLEGKAVMGISRRSKEANVKVIAIVGDIGPNIEEAYQQGLSAIFSINRVAQDFEKVAHRSKEDLELTVDNLFRFLKELAL
ncbi:MAG: glycerate kinase [Sphaerochaetaceae bacterium]